MSFEFLNDLVGVSYSSDFFQLPKGLFVIVEFLLLIVLIFVVRKSSFIMSSSWLLLRSVGILRVLRQVL